MAPSEGTADAKATAAAEEEDHDDEIVRQKTGVSMAFRTREIFWPELTLKLGLLRV